MPGEIIETVMGVLPTIGLLAVLVVGVVIWLIGRRIARTACAVCGLVLGGLGGYVLGEMLSDQGAFVLPLVIGAGIAGALLAGLLFRVWIALSGAALLALAVPAAVLVWQGTPAEEPEATASAEVEAEAEAETAADVPDEPAGPVGVAELLRRSLTEEGELAAGEEAERAEVEEVIEAAADVARQWYDEQTQRVSEWWADLGPGTRGTIYLAGAIGAGLGLVLGLVAPFVAASFESALVGSILLLLAGRELTAMHASGAAAYFPQSPRMVLVWLGLITVLGFAIQWTLFYRRADR